MSTENGGKVQTHTHAYTHTNTHTHTHTLTTQPLHETPISPDLHRLHHDSSTLIYPLLCRIYNCTLLPQSWLYN